MPLTETAAALLCVNGAEIETALAGQIANLGFELHSVSSQEEALQRLKSYPYAVVVVHENFNGDFSQPGPLLSEIAKLPSTPRRSLHLVLVGPGLGNGHPGQAFQFSADLVIDAGACSGFEALLQRSLHEQKAFYAPLYQSLAMAGTA